MGIFDKFGETITSTGKDVANKAKSVADIAKISHQIFLDEEKLNKIFTEIGSKYFDDYCIEPQEKHAFLCNEAYKLKTKIEKQKQQINSMKGIKVCENCGAEVDDEFIFCGKCGAKLPEQIVDDTIIETEIIDENSSENGSENDEEYDNTDNTDEIELLD